MFYRRLVILEAAKGATGHVVARDNMPWLHTPNTKFPTLFLLQPNIFVMILRYRIHVSFANFDLFCARMKPM
jgi:hypothetical protein